MLGLTTGLASEVLSVGGLSVITPHEVINDVEVVVDYVTGGHDVL